MLSDAVNGPQLHVDHKDGVPWRFPDFRAYKGSPHPYLVSRETERTLRKQQSKETVRQSHLVNLGGIGSQVDNPPQEDSQSVPGSKRKTSNDPTPVSQKRPRSTQPETHRPPSGEMAHDATANLAVGLDPEEHQDLFIESSSLDRVTNESEAVPQDDITDFTPPDLPPYKALRAQNAPQGRNRAVPDLSDIRYMPLDNRARFNNGPVFLPQAR